MLSPHTEPYYLETENIAYETITIETTEQSIKKSTITKSNTNGLAKDLEKKVKYPIVKIEK